MPPPQLILRPFLMSSLFFIAQEPQVQVRAEAGTPMQSSMCSVIGEKEEWNWNGCFSVTNGLGLGTELGHARTWTGREGMFIPGVTGNLDEVVQWGWDGNFI